MISVLIPVYNFEVTNLVKSLTNQLQKAKIPFEIICIDDFSDKFNTENAKLEQLSNVTFIKLTKNIGRSCIRNLLVKQANYKWLLFLDADVFIEHNFIKNCLAAINSNLASVYCGGIAYSNQKPNENRILRWKYGKNREEVPSEKRNKRPYHQFSTANFLAHSSVFINCKFDETLVEYGYEDVIFAIDLHLHSVKVMHYSNTVLHLGLETSKKFVEKTEQALLNLSVLKEKYQNLDKYVKLLHYFNLLKKAFGITILAKVFLYFEKTMRKNLLSKNPSLGIFDFYKLGYLCNLELKNESKFG